LAEVSEGGYGTAYRRYFRALGVIFCFLTAAGAASCLLDRCLPFPPVPNVAARFRYFTKHKDEFDTIFIGSSRFHNQIIPLEFDALNAARGVPTHSFNLAYSGMWPPESFYFVRQVLATHPAKLHWVVMELMDYRFGAWEQRPLQMRVVYWHDWTDTMFACRYMLESELRPTEKICQIGLHLWLFLQRSASPGRGYEWLRIRHVRPTEKEDVGWEERAGFDPEPELSRLRKGRSRADFLRGVKEVRESLPEQPLRPGFEAAFKDLLGDFRRAGIEPIFVIPPTINRPENLVLGLPRGITVLRFNRPDKFPQLFHPDMHYDAVHLNEKGAQEFTRLLAGYFADHRKVMTEAR
jgi:hypothetical protein